MFLKNVKNFVLKKYLKNSLSNVDAESLKGPITRVGLIVDESHFLETAALKREIISNGIAENNIKVIVYRDILNTKTIYSEPTFGLKDLNFKCEFTQHFINEFLLDEFDLLINYYNEEKSFLLLLTHNTKAKFKVGFSSVNKKLNHLLINIEPENYKGFVLELFRYLKILNKI